MILSNEAVKAACDAITDIIDREGPGKLFLRGRDDQILVCFTLPFPAFQAAEIVKTAAEATANKIEPSKGTMCAGKGTEAVYFEVLDGAEHLCWVGDVSDIHGRGDLKLTSVMIAKDKKVEIQNWRLRIGRGE